MTAAVRWHRTVHRVRNLLEIVINVAWYITLAALGCFAIGWLLGWVAVGFRAVFG